MARINACIFKFLLVFAVCGLVLSPVVFANAGGNVDINAATVEQLEQLPGIGHKTALAIVKYREEHPFQSVDELTSVKGIGQKKLEKLKPLVTVKAGNDG